MGAACHTISGNPAKIFSPAIMPVESLKLHFSPSQEGSGVPSTANVRNIIGRTSLNGYKAGRNLFDSSQGIQLTNNNILVARGDRIGVPFLMKAGITYTVSCNSTTDPPSEISLRKPYTSGTYIAKYGLNKLTWTPEEDTEVSITIYWVNGRPSDATNIQIEIGDQATPFEPYGGATTTIPVTFQSTGKNLFNPVNVLNAYVGTKIVSGSAYRTAVIPVRPGKTYTISKGSGSRLRVAFTTNAPQIGDDVFGFISNDTLSLTVTAPDGANYMCVYCVYTGEDANTILSTLQVEIGSVATTYVAYDTSTTCYGGYADPADGTLTVEYVMKQNTWGNIRTGTPSETSVVQGGYIYFESPVYYSGDKNTNRSNSSNTFCNVAKYLWKWLENTTDHFYIAFTNNTYRACVILDKNTPADTNIMVVAKLDTPFVVPLAEHDIVSLRGSTTFWSDANETVDATYEVVDSVAMTKAKKRIVANTPHLEQVEPYDFGDIIRFDTNMKAPLKTCGAMFAPTQEGTGDPSPTNVRALIGRKSIEVKQTGKNLCPVIGFSGTGGADTESLRSSHYALTNSYGTTLSNVAGQSVTITQTNYSESQVASYKNGYFGVVFHGLEFGRYYKVSFRVSNIVNNPLNVSLEDMVLANPYGSWFTHPEVIGDRVVFTYLHMANSVRPTQMPIDIRNCGMSCTFSDFMVTSVDEEDQTYVPYEQLPGKNLFYCCAIDKEQAGVSYHRNYDGTVSVSGTATGYSMIELGQAFIDSSAGSIRISGCLDATNMCWDTINLYDSTKTLIVTLDSISGNPYNYVVDISQYTNLSYITLSAKRKNNNTETSGIIKPQIEIASGTTNTTFEPYNDGTYHIDMPYIGKNLFPCREEDMVSDGWNRYFPNPFPEAGTYTISCVAAFGGTGDKGCALAFKDTPSNQAAEIGSHYFGYTFGSSTATTSRQKTITITQEQADAAYIVFLMMSGGSTYETFKYANIQIEHGSTKTFYTPYNDNTIYGAAIDVARGTVYVTHMYAELAAVNRYENANYFFTTAGEQSLGNIAGTNAGLLCNRLKPVVNTTEKDTSPFISFYHNNIIRWVDPDYLSITSANEYNEATASDRVKIVYELAEPIVVQIDPVQIKTLRGYNAIRAGTDEAVGVAYWTH